MDENAICKNDPLIRLLTHYKVGPVGLSVIFIVLAALFTVWLWVVYSEPPPGLQGYISYKQNISWFYSLIFIYPFVLGLTFKYYLDLPHISLNTYEKLRMRLPRADFDQYWEQAFLRIDHPRVVYLAITVAVVANLAYFLSLYYFSSENSWMVYHKSALAQNEFKVTAAGWVAVIIQSLLTYWVVTFTIKGFLYIRTLHQFFRLYRSEIAVNPLHQDGLSGLSEIARLATWQSTILLLLGVYASLKVIDKTFIQDISVLDDPGNMAVLISYVLLAPLMFFSLLGAAHGVMTDAKQEFLAKFNKDTLSFPPDISSTREIKEKIGSLELIMKEQDCRDLFDTKIHVWPFTLRSLQGFFGAVIVPLLPMFIPLLKSLLPFHG